MTWRPSKVAVESAVAAFDPQVTPDPDWVKPMRRALLAAYKKDHPKAECSHRGYIGTYDDPKRIRVDYSKIPGQCLFCVKRTPR